MTSLIDAMSAAFDLTQVPGPDQNLSYAKDAVVIRYYQSRILNNAAVDSAIADRLIAEAKRWIAWRTQNKWCAEMAGEFLEKDHVMDFKVLDEMIKRMPPQSKKTAIIIHPDLYQDLERIRTTIVVIAIGRRFFAGFTKAGRLQTAWSLAGAKTFGLWQTEAMDRVEQKLLTKKQTSRRIEVSIKPA